MPDITSRPSTLAGQASVVVLGALVPLLLVGLTGGGGALGWVALAGGTACASGLVLGSTQRPLPSLAFAAIAAAALALAAAASQRDETKAFRFPAPAIDGSERPHQDARGDARASDRAARVEAAPAASRPAPPLTPARFVRRYYADLEAGRYASAWARLSPAVRSRSTGFEVWRSGYETTLRHRVEHVRLEPGGFVRHDLVAVDRTPCGTTTERRFEVLWRLSPTAGGFTATFLESVQLAGIDPQSAC